MLLHAWLPKWDTQQERSQCRLRAFYEEAHPQTQMFSHTVDLMQLSHYLCWEVGLLKGNELNNALGESYLNEQMFAEIHSTNETNKT